LKSIVFIQKYSVNIREPLEVVISFEIVLNNDNYSGICFDLNQRKFKMVQNLPEDGTRESGNPGSYQCYLLNPGLQIMYNEQWMAVSSISGNQDISEDEIREHSLEKQKREIEEHRKKFEKERKKRERKRWGW
jgi:hypothetical protein